jgi:hypothetical protein
MFFGYARGGVASPLFLSSCRGSQSRAVSQRDLNEASLPQFRGGFRAYFSPVHCRRSCCFCGLRFPESNELAAPFYRSQDAVETEFTSRASRVGREGRSEMDLHVGDTVLVNAAAFIASRLRNRVAVPCEVLEVDGDRFLARTKFPYRIFTIWVSREWLEDADFVTESVSI